MEELLKKIEDQDAETILSEENLLEKFNELLKHNLVALEDGKVVLTERGKIAKEEGLHTFLKNIEKPADLVELPKKDHKKMAVLYLISFFILLLAFVLLVVLHMLSWPL